MGSLNLSLNLRVNLLAACKSRADLRPGERGCRLIARIGSAEPGNRVGTAEYGETVSSREQSAN